MKWKCRDICILVNPTFFRQHGVGVCSSSVPYSPCWQGAGNSCPDLGTLISRTSWGKGRTGRIKGWKKVIAKKKKLVIYTCTDRLADQTQTGKCCTKGSSHIVRWDQTSAKFLASWRQEFTWKLETLTFRWSRSIWVEEVVQRGQSSGTRSLILAASLGRGHQN